jgi:hypothetical protein
LAQFGIDQLHSEGALLVQGKKIPMVASLDPAADVEQTVSNPVCLARREKNTSPTLAAQLFEINQDLRRTQELNTTFGGR